MKSENKIVGGLGESLAADYLVKKGYKIVKRNFATKFGEIDIIANDGRVLVFVEVKTKSGDDFGSPEEMVSKNKIQKVKNMAKIYLNGGEVPCRVDVVAIVLDGERVVRRLSHYENVGG